LNKGAVHCEYLYFVVIVKNATSIGCMCQCSGVDIC
jgi:hypothetical protein